MRNYWIPPFEFLSTIRCYAVSGVYSTINVIDLNLNPLTWLIASNQTCKTRSTNISDFDGIHVSSPRIGNDQNNHHYSSPQLNRLSILSGSQSSVVLESEILRFVWKRPTKWLDRETRRSKFACEPNTRRLWQQRPMRNATINVWACSRYNCDKLCIQFLLPIFARNISFRNAMFFSVAAINSLRPIRLFVWCWTEIE